MMQVVLRAKRCFKKTVTFAAVSFINETGSSVCATNRCVP